MASSSTSGQSLVFCHGYDLDHGNVQEHYKYPWAGAGVSSKLHFRCLLCTKILSFMFEIKTFWTNFSGTRGFLTEKITGFLNSLVVSINMLKSWDILGWSLQRSLKLPDPYTKWLLTSNFKI